MNPDQINIKITEIRELISRHRLADAIGKLMAIASSESDFDVLHSVESINQNYKYLIQYFTLGKEDPTREEQYNAIADSLLEICDTLQVNLNTIANSAITYSVRRIGRHRGDTISNALAKVDEIDRRIDDAAGNPELLRTLAAEHATCMSLLFNTLWSANHDKNGYREIEERLRSDEYSPTLATFIISALTIGLLQFYDSEKLDLLIKIYDNTDNDLIAAPALTGIVLALSQHADRAAQDRRVTSRLRQWEDSILTYSRLRDVVKSIIRTRDTDRASEKMRSEVIPELKKLNPEILKKMKQQGIESDTPLLENNPEWEEMLEKTGIADKMRELTEMQKEGADLLMLTFSNLKNFPFFGEVANWFLPFTPYHPAITLDSSMLRGIVTLFDVTGEMCDSDKYSLALAFAAMPEQQKKMMFDQFQAQLGQMEEQLKGMMEKMPRREFNSAVTLFIRNIYRLMKLYRKHDELNDPFSHPLDFTHLPVIGAMISDTDMLKVVAEFYFKRGYYREALSIFQTLEPELKEDAGYWEKVGFCQQSLQLIPYAFTSYQRAELLKEPSQWLLRRLAFTAKRLGDLNAATGYYTRALAGDPENVQLLISTANILAESGNYGESLLHFYHANYLDPDNRKLWSGIAWLEFLQGNTEKSTRYYNKILNDNPKAADWLNAAHVRLVAGDIPGAIEYYRKSADTDLAAFEKGFESDRKTLLRLGVAPITLDLLQDCIKA